jgi:hypothetical protein
VGRLILSTADADPSALADAPLRATPLRFVVDSGWRPIVTAEVAGIEVPMLIHANAGFLAMLTHDALYRVTGRRVGKESEFGLGHDLRPSPAGRGHVEVPSLSVAGRTLTEVRLEIFDLPTTNWEGMLGVEWLAAVGAVVDFGGSRLLVPYETAPLACPAASGRSIALERDHTTGRFLCRLGLSADGPPSRFVVSTVAETTLDTVHARRHGIELGRPVDEEHGPTGAVVPVYRPAQPVTIWHDGRLITAIRPTVYDIYVYGANQRPDPASAVAGYLGADLLLEQHALVDFGPG